MFLIVAVDSVTQSVARYRHTHKPLVIIGSVLEHTTCYS